MNARLFKMPDQPADPHEAAKSPKKGIVTGVHDLTDLESMIQKYLELAESALKEESAAASSDQDIPA